MGIKNRILRRQPAPEAAGQGDATRLTLPPGARLESFFIDATEQPLTQREGSLALPLHPGNQSISLTWKQPQGIGLIERTPQVTLEDEAANVSLSINVPADRWILWVGKLFTLIIYLVFLAYSVIVGIAFAVLISRFDYRLLRAYTPILWVASVVGLIAVLSPLGKTVNGAHAWIRLSASVASVPRPRELRRSAKHLEALR